ncbi:phosphoribosyltransferase [Flavobacterium xueshanense]|uniref:Predicted phosphoribosyltransferase n=1 Tax=Flavobacterium xueshanense TaxID=935223 RepID=A0A1I2H9F4_9FLAO|nr:phosphoribosyltransferase family protein [Flavobacterium xueshanense]SFF26198.1 Predicted phosphoribosyltransferase [Flavobacterium xueshanense]
MYNEILKDRTEAGFLLSEKLKKYQDTNSVILAVPRGGVPVGFVISKILHLPLDIVLAKKIGHPSNKEFAIGAVSMDSMIIDEHSDIPKKYIDNEIIRLRQQLDEKYGRYMGDRKPLAIENKNVILVDDGIATGNTLLSCITMLRKKNPSKIIVAVPVLPFDTVPLFEKNADELIYLTASKYFRGVGSFYEKFNQVEDEEVTQMLRLATTTE